MSRTLCLLALLCAVVLSSSVFATTLYFPHIASGGVWETEVGIVNTSGESLTGILYGYNDAGAQVESKEISLAAGGRSELTLGSDFTTATQITNMAFETDSDCTGYEKFYTSDYRVAVPAVSNINTGDLYIPHIASGGGWWTGVALLNTNDSSRTLTFTFSDGSQGSLELAAGQHWAGTIQGSFPEVNASSIQSAVISNADGVIGLELFGSQTGSGNNYLSGVTLSNQTATSLYYPHIASDSTWWTGLVIYNPSTTTQATLTITPYSDSGSALGSITQPLDPQGKYIGTASGLNLPEGTAWVKVDSTLPVTGFELFGTHDGKQLAGYSSVNINTTAGTFVKLDHEGWTGIAFVNSSSSAADVTLTAKDNSGTTIATNTLSLAANGKQVYLANNFFVDDITVASYIDFSADEEVVSFQLNGSYDEMLLDALPGLEFVTQYPPQEEFHGYVDSEPNNNTLGNFTEVQTVEVPCSVEGAINYDLDRRDVFEFTADGNYTAYIYISGLGDDWLQLLVYDPVENTYDSPAAAWPNVNKDLVAGRTYYVEVYSNGDSPLYELIINKHHY